MDVIMFEVIIWILGILAPFIGVRLFSVANELVESREEADLLRRKVLALKNKEVSLNKLSITYIELLKSMLKNSINTSNLVTTFKKLESSAKKLEKIGIVITRSEINDIKIELQGIFEEVVRKDAAKKVQSEIKAKIREEQREAKMIEQEIRRIAREQQIIEKALSTALKKAGDTHSAEVDALKAKLEDAMERAGRAKSMAQQTRAGYVYVISNTGSFGKDVYKVGMTRRLEPMDRIKELGDASVPFSFDVHMMISCNDAPTLEKNMHKDLSQYRVNKVNNRKEFFKVSIDKIAKFVEKNHGTVDYKAEADAFEYNESKVMSANDMMYIDTVLQ